MTTATALRALADLLDEVDLPEPADYFDGVGIGTQTAYEGLRVHGDPVRVQILADHLGVTLTYGHTDEDGNGYASGSTQIDGHGLTLTAVTRPTPLEVTLTAHDLDALRCSTHPDRESVGGSAGGGQPTVLCCQECMSAVFEDAL